MNPTDVARLEMAIRAEVRDDGQRGTVITQIVPALQLLADSLDLPVSLRAELCDGPGRILIGNTAPLLPDLPGFDGRIESHDVWFYAPQLVTPKLVEHLWHQWYPARASDLQHPQFSVRLAEMLRSAVTLGFRLDRFREAIAELRADAAHERWITSFEDVLSAADCPRFRLFLSPEQYAQAMDARVEHSSTKSWSDLVAFMMEGLFTELGVVYPRLELAVDDSLSPPWFRCEWNDLRLPPRQGLLLDQTLVNDTVDRLRIMNVEDAAEAINPATGQPGAIVGAHRREGLEATGLTTWDMRGYLMLAMAQLMRDAAGAFVTAPFTEYLLLITEEVYPELISAVRSRFSLAALTAILRGIVAEGVQLNYVQTIFTALATVQSTFQADVVSHIPLTEPASNAYITGVPKRIDNLSSADYVAIVRRALRRSISRSFSRGTATLVVYLIDKEIETALARQTPPDFRQQLHKALAAELSHLPPTASRPHLLINPDARARLKEELYPEYRRYKVLSYDDVDPEINLQPVARISMR